MYDRKKILVGLGIFVLLVTVPIWYNHGDAGAAPEVELPENAEHCVLSAEEMRAKHMVLLNRWRDDVLRDGDRAGIEIDGKHYPKSLMLTCMGCHTSKVKFCDRCHEYVSVKPYCWDCHLAPVE
ncbi:MAG: cytochrome C [Desulfobulbus propionicus]|nr:MAG: cytochrome C [Desulfobulbus propionicus]